MIAETRMIEAECEDIRKRWLHAASMWTRPHAIKSGKADVRNLVRAIRDAWAETERVTQRLAEADATIRRLQNRRRLMMASKRLSIGLEEHVERLLDKWVPEQNESNPVTIPRLFREDLRKFARRATCETCELTDLAEGDSVRTMTRDRVR